MMNLRTMLEEASHIAVIGMNPDPEKFAHKINALLEERGKSTFGVNRNYTEIEGKTIYPSITDIPSPIDIAVMVVNPTVGFSMLDDIAAKGVKTLWLQPGTRSQEITDKATALGLVIVEDCVLIQYK